jgi:hypothetical protein
MRQLYLNFNVLANPLPKPTPAAAWQLTRDPFRYLPHKPANYRNLLSCLVEDREAPQVASPGRAP